jgi:phosphoribosyl-ATP pyrophosphohydrolase
MERRELMLGIAEKLPKSTAKPPKSVPDKVIADKPVSPKTSPKAAAPSAVRRRIVALEAHSLRKRH